MGLFLSPFWPQILFLPSTFCFTLPATPFDCPIRRSIVHDCWLKALKAQTSSLNRRMSRQTFYFIPSSSFKRFFIAYFHAVGRMHLRSILIVLLGFSSLRSSYSIASSPLKTSAQYVVLRVEVFWYSTVTSVLQLLYANACWIIYLFLVANQVQRILPHLFICQRVNGRCSVYLVEPFHNYWIFQKFAIDSCLVSRGL